VPVRVEGGAAPAASVGVAKLGRHGGAACPALI
jgi:hypothetical protein